MKINVVVCTYNRAVGLARCLEALGRQTVPSSDFGILVVNNGSDDETESVVARLMETMPNLRYQFDPVPDVSKARNTGLAMTTCELVGYLDDDEEPAVDWVERMLVWFASLPLSVVAVGGDLDPVWEVPRPSWLAERFLQFYSVNLNWSPTARRIKPPEWLGEGNVALRTGPLREAGGFPSELGRKSNLLLSGENFVLDMMSRSGLDLFFDPAIRVKHFIPANRLTKTWLRRRLFWSGVTAAQLPVVGSKHGQQIPYWNEVDVPQSPADWLAILSDDDDPVDGSLQTLFDLGYLLGFAGVVLGR